MRHGSLFSGIGGFDLAAEIMGWENVFHCEWEEFPKKILKYYWPNAISYENICTTDFTVHRGSIDIISGGFPCQPFSQAGNRKGTNDSRYLWPEMLRVIREIRPKWVVGENVYGLVNWDGGLVFDTIVNDLENEGYKVIPIVLPAASVGAPHQRQRIFFIAHSTIEGLERPTGESIQGNINGLANCSNADASDSMPVRLQYSEIRREMGGGQKEMGRQGSKFTDAIKANGEDEIASNTYNNRQHGHGSQNEEQSVNGRVNAQHDFDEMPSEGNAADSKSERYQSFDKDRTAIFSTQNESGLHGRSRDSFNKPCSWESFPTVSPVCDGDDGLSDRLDNITFSKWRKESIKGGGNAVVPPLILQIFKTIEKVSQF